MIQQRTCRQPNDAHRPRVGLRSQSCRGGVDLEEERGHLTSQLRARDSGSESTGPAPRARAFKQKHELSVSKARMFALAFCSIPLEPSSPSSSSACSSPSLSLVSSLVPLWLSTVTLLQPRIVVSLDPSAPRPKSPKSRPIRLAGRKTNRPTAKNHAKPYPQNLSLHSLQCRSWLQLYRVGAILLAVLIRLRDEERPYVSGFSGLREFRHGRQAFGLAVWPVLGLEVSGSV